MKRREKVQNQILFLLEENGPLNSNQLAAMSSPVTSVAEITLAVEEMRAEGEVVKIDGLWNLVDDGADDADAA